MSKEEKDLSYIRENFEHFTGFLDGFMIYETDTRSEGFIVSTEEMDMDNPIQLEINTDIAKLKNNKAPGSYSIPVKLLKFEGAEMSERIYQIIS